MDISVFCSEVAIVIINIGTDVVMVLRLATRTHHTLVMPQLLMFVFGSIPQLWLATVS